MDKNGMRMDRNWEGVGRKWEGMERKWERDGKKLKGMDGNETETTRLLPTAEVFFSVFFVRYLTFFYYLNEPTLGGETAFPIADNKTVPVNEVC